MKKLIALALIVTLSFSMIACNKTKESEPTSNTTSTEDSTTTETTTTQETTSEFVFEDITYEMYEHALEVAFKAEEESIIYVTNDGAYLEHGAFSSYYPFVVSSGYGVFTDNEIVNDVYTSAYESIQNFEPDDRSYTIFIDEEDYQIIYTYVTGLDDLTERFGGESIYVYDYAEEFYLDVNDMSMIDFYYIAGNQLISTTVITDTNEGIEAMDTFISELGLPEV